MKMFYHGGDFMKIDGMDASNVSFNTLRETTTKRETANNSQQTNPITENKSISQISDYEKKELPISENVVIEAIEKANRAISGANRKFEFSIHEKTKEIMIKVIDSDTNEVVREIPPEKILDMVAKMWEMAGIIVDERR